MCLEDDYFFETDFHHAKDKRAFVLIAYDITSNKKRNKFAKFLQGYGFRIQKSIFEALISEKLYDSMVAKIGQFASDEDNIRVYKIKGYGEVKNFGRKIQDLSEETIIV